MLSVFYLVYPVPQSCEVSYPVVRQRAPEGGCGGKWWRRDFTLVCLALKPVSFRYVPVSSLERTHKGIHSWGRNAEDS